MIAYDERRVIVRHANQEIARKNPTKKVVALRPKSFTENERFIEEIREAIFISGISYEKLAGKDMSHTTVQRLASGKTKWPRPSTLFPLLDRLGLELAIQRSKKK